MTPPIEAVAMVTYLSFFVKNLVTSNGVLLPLGYLVVFIVLLAILIVYQGYSGIFYALVLGGIVFSFEGFRGAINMAAESKHKDYIWKSVIVALLLVMALYVFIQVAFIGALDWAKSGIAVGDWGGLAVKPSTLLSGPFAKEAEFAGLGWLVVILLIDAVVSPGGAGLSYAAYPARIFQSMAEFGYAPSWFKNLTDKTKVPGRALILGFLVGLLFLYEFPGFSL